MPARSVAGLQQHAPGAEFASISCTGGAGVGLGGVARAREPVGEHGDADASRCTCSARPDRNTPTTAPATPRRPRSNRLQRRGEPLGAGVEILLRQGCVGVEVLLRHGRRGRRGLAWRAPPARPGRAWWRRRPSPRAAGAPSGCAAPFGVIASLSRRMSWCRSASLMDMLSSGRAPRTNGLRGRRTQARPGCREADPAGLAPPTRPPMNAAEPGRVDEGLGLPDAAAAPQRGEVARGRPLGPRPPTLLRRARRCRGGEERGLASTPVRRFGPGPAGRWATSTVMSWVPGRSSGVAPRAWPGRSAATRPSGRAPARQVGASSRATTSRPATSRSSTSRQPGRGADRDRHPGAGRGIGRSAVGDQLGDRGRAGTSTSTQARRRPRPPTPRASRRPRARTGRRAGCRAARWPARRPARATFGQLGEADRDRADAGRRAAPRPRRPRRRRPRRPARAGGGRRGGPAATAERSTST